MGTHDTRDNDHDDNQAPQSTEPQPTNEEMSLALIEEQADRTIRRVWHDGRWFFSVIDIIAVLTESTAPRKYWFAMRKRITDEGFRDASTKCRRMPMMSRDGVERETDAADTETMLRIIQSIPSPKAEPIKQWLARVGARKLDEVTRPLNAGDARAERAALVKPAVDAPALEWAEYHERLAALYRRQAAYESRMAVVEDRLDDHEEQIGELHSRMESLEAGTRMLPELLMRLGPQTLAPEHQATVRAMAKRLHELGGYGFGAIYSELNEAFHVGRYSDIPDARWDEVAAWLSVRIKAAEQRRG